MSGLNQGYGELMSAKHLVLIDGYSLLFRAFFGTRFLSTSDGRPTNALFGFVGMLFTLIEREKPDAILVALDAEGRTFRHDEYEAYKGTRRETAPELIQQFPVFRELIQAFGIPFLELPGYEADDIVGTISLQAENAGYRTTIVTGDLDSLQLVDHAVNVMTTRQGVTDVVIYDPEQVRQRYGFGPEFITDYKALVGDSSDNIPGVPGIGDKSATKLILQFGSVESILEHLPDVEEKFRKKIEPHVEQLKKSKWLATILRDVPVHYDFAPYRPTSAQIESALEMLQALEFRHYAKKAPGILMSLGNTSPAGVSQGIIQAIVGLESIQPVELGKKDLAHAIQWLDGRPYALMFTSDRTQLSMFEDEATSAFIAQGNEVIEVETFDALTLFGIDPSRARVYDAKPLYKKIAPNLTPPQFDALIGAYVLNPGSLQYSLRDLITEYLDLEPPTTGAGQAAALWHLSETLEGRLQKEHQDAVCREIEFPIIPILAEMEQYGIAVDREILDDMSRSLKSNIDELTHRIHKMAGQEFLIASPKQLGEVLFEKLGLPGGKKSKTGWATGAEILQELVNDYPICGEILNWRELTKLKGTYTDALPKLVGPDGRIHTTFNQTVASTGRLSSVDPNLQNIPIRTQTGRNIRRAFVAAPGYTLGSLDYSQIELRLLAHLCRDEHLVEAFRSHVDIHLITACLMFHVKPDSVTRDQRRLAKLLNYAVLYGVSEFGLAQQLGAEFSISDAKELIKQYFERFPRVRDFIETTIADARQKGFTTTLRGRRRPCPDIHAQSATVRKYAERQAVNAPIQGAAADLAKLAMIDARKLLGKSASRMLLQVHDELVFEFGEDREQLLAPIRHAMEQAMPIDVPIEVDAKVGPNWLEMEPVQGSR